MRVKLLQAASCALQAGSRFQSAMLRRLVLLLVLCLYACWHENVVFPCCACSAVALVSWISHHKQQKELTACMWQLTD